MSSSIVVFDLGGVLVRICRSWAEGCAAAGLEVRDGEAGAASQAMAARRHALAAAYHAGELSCEAFFSQLSEVMGGLYSPEEVARIHDAWLLGVYDGVETLIEELCAAGVTTGVLSNTNHRHWTTMHGAYVWLGRIMHPHASHLLRACKPDDGIYKLFEMRTAAAPGEIIFFDDLEENIAAARRRGWNAHQIDYTGDTTGQMRRLLAEAGVLR